MPEVNIDDADQRSAKDRKSLYLTEIELAERWQVSPKTLQNWRVAGGGVSYVKGRRFVRYPLTAVQAWEADHTRRSTSEGGRDAS